MNSSFRLLVVSLAAFAASVAVGCDTKSQSVSGRPAVNTPSDHLGANAPSDRPTANVPSDRRSAVAPATNPVEVVKGEAKGTESLPPVTLQKLDPHLVQALKTRRGAPAPGQPPTLDPDIPVQDGGRVLVDMKATVSPELLEQVALLGGTVVSSAETTRTVRAMVPFTQLAALAGRADVESIAPGTLTVTREAGSSLSAAPGASKAGP